MNKIKLYVMSIIGALIGTLSVGLLTVSGNGYVTTMPVMLFTVGCLFAAWSMTGRK
jgi:hypothetical protein